MSFSAAEIVKVHQRMSAGSHGPLLCDVVLPVGGQILAVVKPLPDKRLRAAELVGPIYAAAVGVRSMPAFLAFLESRHAASLQTCVNSRQVPHRAYGGGLVPATGYVPTKPISPTQMSDGDVSRIAAYDILSYNKYRVMLASDCQVMRACSVARPMLFGFNESFPPDELLLDPACSATWNDLAHAGNIILSEARKRSLGADVEQILASVAIPSPPPSPKSWKPSFRHFADWSGKVVQERRMAVKEVIG